MKELKNMMKSNNTKLLANFNKELKDSDFKEFVDILGLSYEELCKYTSILKESSIEYHNCKNCKNIMECKNKMIGHAYLPKVKDNNITFSYQICKYLKDIEEKNRYLDNIYTFDIPEQLRTANIKDIYKTDKNRFNVIKYIGNFIKEYQKDKKQKGLYLYGNFGCGKTYLISAMFNELAKKDVKGAIIFWPEYLRMLKSSFNTFEFNDNFNKIKEAPLLLIDDIGAENMTPWSRDEILCSILQYRMEEHLPTFFTSNLSLEELETHLGGGVKARRIIERIKQLTKEEKMISKNLRN